MLKLRYCVLAMALLSLSACGFHLRGSVELPQSMARTYIGAPSGSVLQTELGQMISGAGGEVVTDRDTATALLTLHNEKLSSRVRTLDNQGRASEHVISLQVSFSMRDVSGRIFAKEELARVERDFSFDPDDVLARENEERLVREEVYRQVAQGILRRLRILSKKVNVDNSKEK